MQEGAAGGLEVPSHHSAQVAQAVGMYLPMSARGRACLPASGVLTSAVLCSLRVAGWSLQHTGVRCACACAALPLLLLQVLDVQLLGSPLSSLFGSGGPPSVSLLVGDPWAGGARSQLDLPYAPRAEAVQVQAAIAAPETPRPVHHPLRLSALVNEPRSLAPPLPVPWHS